MSIFAVETPHQRKPICWVADDQADFIAKVAAVEQELPDDATFEAAIEWARRDLSDLRVFASADDAARAYLAGWDGHQSAAAMDALLAEVARRDFEIEDPRLRLQLLGAVWDRARDDEREIAGSAYDAAKAAAEAGMPETQIAEALGVNRMTVRRALGKR